MESNRQKRISRLLQKDLGEIFQIEAKSWFQSAMITVTKVNVTADMSLARVYISIFGKDANAVLGIIEINNKQIRKKLGDRVKNQIRKVPELRFSIDDSLDYLENIEKLLKE